MRESIWRHWEDIKGNLKWDTIKLLYSFLPYIGVGALVAGYIAFKAWIDAQPGYFVASLFLGVFAFIVTIANGIREWQLWSQWKRRQLALPHEPKGSPSLSETTDQMAESALRQKIVDLETQLSRERDAGATRRKQQEALHRLIRRGQEILSLYKLKDPLTDLEDAGWKWEGDVKTYLHNFLHESYVTRFLNHTDVILYPEVASEIAEEYRQAYLATYAQILQLQKFLEEVQKDTN